jgi:hypothetical protein
MAYRKEITLIFSVIGTIIGVFAIGIPFFWKDLYFNVPTCAQLIASKNFVPSEIGETSYIEKPALESLLSSFIGHLGIVYAVLHGPKGSGKSSVVQKVISSQPFGVISLLLDDTNSNLYAAFAKKVCGIRNEVWYFDDVADVLRSAIVIAGKTKKVPFDWVPTLVVEVEMSATHHSVNEIARHVKVLCSDEELCRGVIVLNDALAASALPNDPGRTKMIWVDDFSESQANSYFDKRGYLLGSDCVNVSRNECTTAATLRKHIFDTIGTRPTILSRAIGETQHNLSLIEPFLDGLLADCQRVLVNLFYSKGSPSGLEFKALANLILESPTLSVHQADPKRMVIFPYPVDVAVNILEKYHAMLFHSPTSSYRFVSQCSAIAAERLLGHRNQSETTMLSFV